MVSIVKEFGKTKTFAYCDKCGAGYEYAAKVSITRVESILRGKGWKVGKEHTCERRKAQSGRE